MVERNIQQNNPDTPITKPAVFDFNNPSLKFETETIIVGMKTWKDVDKVFAKLTNSITNDFQPDKTIKIHLINFPNLEALFKTRDQKSGFYGQSTTFEIKLLPTDLTIAPKRKTEPDPKLAKTFLLSRQIHYPTLPVEETIVLTECTISLVDKGIFSTPNSYDDGYDYKQNFGASIGFKAIAEHGLQIINKAKNATSSVSARRHAPLTVKKGRL